MTEQIYLAVTFMTRIPLPAWRGEIESGLSDAAWAFSLAGVLIGSIAALFLWSMSSLQMDSLVVSTLLLAFLALITGALHEDGLADACDGFGGGSSRVRKLEIMKDSRIGTYGVLALVLSTFVKIVAISQLIEFSTALASVALVTTHALARATMPLTMVWQNPAKTSGLASGAGSVSSSSAWIGLIIAVCTCLIFLGLVTTLWLTGIALLVSLAMMLLSYRQIGGYTGDTLGAQQQIVEVLLLITLTILMTG
jgi:adenosylcobinamide-GDP ribazoletransferase